MYKVLTILFLYLVSIPASAELSGREIMQRAEDNDTSITSKMNTVMVIQRGSQKLVRKIESLRKKFGDDEKSLIRFIKPADVKDTMYLTWSYKDIEREDDMWLYLPAESLVRRISRGGKKGAFMRSDFANEDIQKREVDDDKHTFLKREIFSDIDCYVVENLPMKKHDTGYSKKITWIHPDLFLPVKVEYFDKRGKLLKKALYGGYKVIDSINVFTKILMETPKKGTKTFFERNNIEFDISISDSVFEQSNLKR